MAILASDVQLVKSKVMLDVPEGGQGPTGHVIVDGLSNEIFVDVSESDRTIGRLNAMKVHVHIDTNGNEQYLGAHMIVSNPPTDPAISVTLVDTGETFDTRAEAMSRASAYYNIGTTYNGYLFGNHIQGMTTVSMSQRTADLPAIGSTLVLTKREGFSNEFVQYVRVIDADAVLRNYTDAGGDFQRYEITLEISDPLLVDFPGFDITRYEIDSASMANKTRISRTLPANAATYKGVAELTEDVTTGDFECHVESIFTQFVPSAQTETPVADARANQVSQALIQSGENVVLTVNAVLTPSQALFIGGGIYPGSLTVARDGTTLVDEGGKLVLSGDQRGNVDYVNGIITVVDTSTWGGGGGNFTITYKPAAVPQTISKSQGFPITAPNRALNYIRTIEPVPVKGSMKVSYRAQNAWYELQDDGSGALRGLSSAYGAGNINFTTGTVSVTLGALPDVGSALIYQWVEAGSEAANSEIAIDNDSKLYWPFNADGDVTLDKATVSFVPSAVEITWNDGVDDRTVTDDGEGNLTGYGTGTVNYSRGTLKLSPTTLPPKGTTISVNRDSNARLTTTLTPSDMGGTQNFIIGAGNIVPGSVYITMPIQRKYTYQNGALKNFGAPVSAIIIDDGQGNLGMFVTVTFTQNWWIVVGTIDYPSGVGQITSQINLADDQAAKFTAYDNIYITAPPPSGGIFVTQSQR